MPLRRRLWAILAAAYVTATAVTQMLWSGGPSLTAVAVGRAAAVIAVQIGALEIAARLAGLYRRDGRADGVAGFLILWFCLMIAFGVATLAFGLLIRQIDLTSVAVFSLMTVPSVQAWAVMATFGPGPSPGSGWRLFLRHPLTRPRYSARCRCSRSGSPAQPPLVGLAAAVGPCSGGGSARASLRRR
jgi:hypothetical protein